MSEYPAQPQGDGDPSQVYDLGDMWVKAPSLAAAESEAQEVRREERRLFHIEKSGPAFKLCPICGRPLSQCDGTLPRVSQRPVQDMLTRSLQSQAVKITGETLNALRRCCLLDLVKCWPRLLKVVNVTSLGARAYLRQSWEWQEMREAVELALCYAEQPESLHWQRADALLRGYAMQAAMAIESRLGTEDYDAESLAIVTLNAGAYRAFSEGRM